MIRIEELGEAGLDRMGEIDRSEEVTYQYLFREGALHRERIDAQVPTWTPETIEKNRHMLLPILRKGGHCLGALAGDRLAGMAVLGGEWLGEEQDQLQMAFLYVSREYRRQGVARKLMDEICRLAREKQANQLYISATETDSALGFYFAYGCRLAPKVDRDLYALEPLESIW